MHSPRSLKFSPVLPNISNGNSLPSSSLELLKQIRFNQFKELKKQGLLSLSGSGGTTGSFQERESERMENILMKFEDEYITPSRERTISGGERAKMESEDIISAIFENSMKESDKARFRMQIRREAEERKRLEEMERMNRRRLAEERRMAVVDRIKKKKEEEELKIKEAELALIREIQEIERAEQAKLQNLMNERFRFQFEDEISRICEMDFREEISRKKWREAEELKLALWEAKQMEIDRLENLEREKRREQLEEKKQKLAELKKNFQPSAATATNSTMQAAKDEAAKISKNMRIQNKAKYVSKMSKTLIAPVELSVNVIFGSGEALRRHPNSDLVLGLRLLREASLRVFAAASHTHAPKRLYPQSSSTRCPRR